MPRKDVATKTLPKSSYVSVAQSPAEEQKARRNNEARNRYCAVVKRLCACLTRSFTENIKKARRIARGAPSEEPKLLATHSKHRAATVCLIHVMPVLASIVLAAMNLKGFYIGAQLSGSSDPSTQAIYRLYLQTTAKLLVRSVKDHTDIANECLFQELAAVASLGVIVLDVVRYLLFFDDQGLPLGLAGTKMKFNDVTLLASPAFWSGIRGLNSWRKKILVTLLIVICCLLATFLGPSSALLLIPVVRTDWAAGGTLFWLSGNTSTLWPDTLDFSSIGGQECLMPTADKIYAENLNNSGCIWYWTSGLTQYTKDLHFGTGIFNVTVFDAIAAREVQRRPSGDTWALSSMAHIARMALAIGMQWIDAALFANENWSPLRTGRSFLFRQRSGTVTKVHSPVPAVRTKCGVYEPADFNSTAVFAVCAI